ARGKQMRAREPLGHAITRAHGDAHVTLATFEPKDCRTEEKAHSLGRQLLHYRAREIGILAREYLRGDVDNGDFAAETPERLGHFAADRPRADDDQCRHRLAQV